MSCNDEAKPLLDRPFKDKFPWWMFWKRRRYVVAILAFFGFFNVYALRVNLSMAIVAMTADKTILHENGTVAHSKDFDWDSRTQGYILSSFFYGYITTQLLGGWLGSRIGGKKVFGLGIGMTAALTLITPWMANTSVYLFIALRVVEGIFEGVTYPCIHAVWSRWAPPLERTRLASISFSGSYVGTVFAMPVSAYLAEYYAWPSIFYFFGTIGIIWTVIWWRVVAESPAEDPEITKEEYLYITESLGNSDPNRIIIHPWKKILTSVPVWALVVAHFSENWGFYTLLTQLPKFMNDILAFNLGTTGFMSALPYVAMAFTLPLSGQCADWLQVKGILTTTQVRKTFNFIGFMAQAAFMLGVAFSVTVTGVTICLTLAVSVGALAWSGFSVNYLDIAPNHASVLMGLGNTFGTIPGIISPILCGYIVSTPTADEWRTVFYITSAIYFIGCIFYVTFATSELQPWAVDPGNESKTKAQKDVGIYNHAFQTSEA